jgi:uncharacterized protein YjbI with pentapeptide repeats
MNTELLNKSYNEILNILNVKNLNNVVLNNYNLEGIVIKGKSAGNNLFLDNCKLINCNLTGCQLTNIVFKNCDFSMSNITNGIINKCIIHNTNFSNTNLTNIVINKSNISNSNFNNSPFINGYISNTVFKDNIFNKQSYKLTLEKTTITPPLPEEHNGVLYKYISLLGVGGYGEVWKAEMHKNSTVKLVAIKRYLKGRNYDNEYSILVSIKDFCFEYAVCIIDLYTNDGNPRLVMDFIEGISLKQYIDEVPLDKRIKNINIIIHLIRGLLEFRKYNIAHQDIKEENIIYDKKSKKFKYIDWGLGCVKIKSCEVTCKDNCGAIGTKYTTPLEILNLKYLDPIYFNMTLNHDLWSIGTVLYNFYSIDKNVINYYYIKHTNLLNKKHSLQYKSQASIDSLIDKLNVDKYIKKLIKLLLTIDPVKRLENFRIVEKCISRETLM